MRKSRYLLYLALTIILAAMCRTAAVSAGQINITLCDNQPPELTITSPQSDSVVDVPTITLTGTAQRTSQIDIVVNGAYVTSVAIGGQNPDFSRQLTLKAGTNTIELNAFFGCNQTSSQTVIVVTYEPKAVPDNNNGKDTSVSPTGADRPRTVTAPKHGGYSLLSPAGDEEDSILERLERRISWPDYVTDQAAGSRSTLQKIGYVLPGWLGLAAMVFGTSLIALPGLIVSSSLWPAGRRQWWSAKHHWRARVAGLILLLSALFILIH